MQKKKIPKKELERYLLEKFISNESLSLRIKKIEESETPDFIIHELNKTFSIELTRLIHPHLIEIESLQEKIVNLALEKFKNKYTAKLTVYVNFLKVPLDGKGDGISSYVNDLYQIVEQIYLPNESYAFKVTSLGRKRPVNWFIDSITVTNEENFENWQPFGAFKVNQIDPNWIKDVIEQKEKNLFKYRDQYKECKIRLH